jgi:hypothetical protein
VKRGLVGKQDLPAYLDAHPSASAAPPVVTRPQLLPFRELTWPHFETLVARVVRIYAEPEQCQIYGMPGQAQKGIDIFARRGNFAAAYRKGSHPPTGTQASRSSDRVVDDMMVLPSTRFSNFSGMPGADFANQKMPTPSSSVRV